MNKRYLNIETQVADVKDDCNALMLGDIRAVDTNNQVADIVADEVIIAIVATNYENNQNKDFKIFLSATINIGDSIGSIQGNYEVNYRYNQITNELITKCTTNGELFNSATEYISATESALTRITVDEKGMAKKVAISAPNGEKLYLYNNPFKAIIDHMDANNLLNIIKLNGDYMYRANLVMSTCKNEVKPIENISVNTLFDYMVSVTNIDADSIDCIKKTVNKDGLIVYNFYINNDAALSIKDKISEILNPNITDGLIGIDNFYNEDNCVVDNSLMVVEMVDSEIKSIGVDNRIKYYPTDGEFIDEQITLINSINIDFNSCFHRAAKYNKPKNATELIREIVFSDEE